MANTIVAADYQGIVKRGPAGRKRVVMLLAREEYIYNLPEVLSKELKEGEIVQIRFSVLRVGNGQ